MLRNSIGMEFVLIPTGEFMMGSNDGDSDEKPVHTVRLTQPFYLGKYEVTQGQWQVVMGANPSHFTGDPNRPVENVSWDDVQEFIRQLNAKEGETRYRLPAEAEWEYAARAGTTTRWSFGDDASQLGRYAWYEDNAGGTTHRVGQLQPNAWGLYDMHGNVWEWVQDWYASYGLQEGKICRYRLLSLSIRHRQTPQASCSGGSLRAGWKGLFASAVKLFSSRRMGSIVLEESTP